MHELRDLMEIVETIAVVGVSAKAHKAGHYVPAYLKHQGYRVIGVSPVLTEAFGERTYRQVQDIPEPVDLILVFRRSEHLPDHLADFLATSPRPKGVWLQLGIAHDEVATALRAVGVTVVQDRCLMVDHRNMF